MSAHRPEGPAQNQGRVSGRLGPVVEDISILVCRPPVTPALGLVKRDDLVALVDGMDAALATVK